MARVIELARDASNGTGFNSTWDGGEGILHGTGTWGGATVKLQYAPMSPVSTYNLVAADTDVEIDSSGPNQSFNYLPAGRIRVVISGGDGSESLTVVISR